uniref:Uncharacterized protein n=1 Tax=Chromera velia CCMP2878 TaxID=1169474 RepID=A0A0G4IDM9_9ALVE|eukprot:Cvel_13487.t1-p1 / transcript=Cvel_13487.t1 / gene=Cvel_13487 / organism=Chromera_velia_CCMP2878 / gene_product=hypothetical protein / transcript_product=hypothetical protein / location=Cvel_scaffold923:10470-11183(+) / protein_length=238 / sequence_SO=supercontig / SO=protein_coding / is_pseudo=false
MRVGDTTVVSMPSLGTELRGVIMQFIALLTHDVVAMLHRYKKKNVQGERFTVLQVHFEYLQTLPDSIRLWGGLRFDQEGTILLAPAGGEQEDPRLWRTSVRQERGFRIGARYRRRAGRSDLRHRRFPLVFPGTSPVGRYRGIQRETQWPAKKFSFQLANEGEGVDVGLREAPRLTHLREGHLEISSTETQVSSSSSSSSALPSAVPPSLPPIVPAKPPAEPPSLPPTVPAQLSASSRA